MYRKKAHIHFVGIGGIGMSGIAHVLRHQGYTISGCDADTAQKSVQQLQALGCTVIQGNNQSACADPSIDILVYSSAIQAHNPEIMAAQQRGIPTIARALMLAELMRTKYSIAIAGSHGKTTTTSMLSHILIEAGLDPTVIIGGHLINMSTNARMGNGDFLVAEADESDRSFLHLQATLALVTNIDLEHLETYSDLADVKQTYIRFLNNLPFYGKAFICIDNPVIRSMLPLPHIKLVSYGLSEEAALTARNVHLEADSTSCDIVEHGINLGTITLNMPGKHNLLNCLGAFAIARELEVPFAAIKQALQHFKGVERRFWYRGSYKGAEVFDDYGHHPKEIEAVLNVARRRAKNRLCVVFQPHRYSRTHHLWLDFKNVFLAHFAEYAAKPGVDTQGIDAIQTLQAIQTIDTQTIDTLIITDIYPASEEPIAGVTAERMVKELQAARPELMVFYAPYDESFQAIKDLLDQQIQADDLILLLGAGRLTYLPQRLS
jgi:UDP-N-acetylmuramate--alanine ligase